MDIDVLQRAAATALVRLRESGIEPGYLADLAQVRTRWWFTKHDRFIERARVWPLGVLLLDGNGEFFTTGETVRAIPPGYPGHTSAERERRRDLTRIAFESDFPEGSIIYTGGTRIDVQLLASGNNAEPIVWNGSELHVRWSRNDPALPTRPFTNYLAEQVDLAVERHHRSLAE